MGTFYVMPLILDGALKFQMNFARGKWEGSKRLNKTKKKYFIENKPKKHNDQTLMSRMNGDRCK